MISSPYSLKKYEGIQSTRVVPLRGPRGYPVVQLNDTYTETKRGPARGGGGGGAGYSYTENRRLSKKERGGEKARIGPEQTIRKEPGMRSSPEKEIDHAKRGIE